MSLPRYRQNQSLTDYTVKTGCAAKYINVIDRDKFTTKCAAFKNVIAAGFYLNTCKLRRVLSEVDEDRARTFVLYDQVRAQFVCWHNSQCSRADREREKR